MQIEVRGSNVSVSDDLREHVEKRFRRVDRQVSELAVLEVELRQETNPGIPDPHVVEATLHLKGATLRAHDRGRDARHAVNLCEEELTRQVKRHRDKRRGRRKGDTPSIRTTPTDALGGGLSAAP